MTRRQAIITLAIAGFESVLPSSVLSRADAVGGWKKYSGNPVLGGRYGTFFDVCVLREQNLYRMWVSWRPKQSIAITESPDGIHWKPTEIVLGPKPQTGWEDDINRPVVVHGQDGYHMWYTGQAKGKSSIGYATSADGVTWTRKSDQPVLVSEAPWEGVAVMCPHVMWEPSRDLWRMWYSAGEQYEPNAIGYATSKDGLHWEKYASNPILAPDVRLDWEKNRVTAAQILFWKDWYYAFYIGFRDVDHAQIGLARSKDGITNWVRHTDNPIVRPTPGGWDADACYKPFAVYSDGEWKLWYNGRNKSVEQIGLATHAGEDLGFQA